ncbi:MAG TPA: acyl-CoA dehydrogenase family protein [Actinomycetota bacterium]|nr:acyl-CoA dehydrogenase family protein [Actinomycetota bacterium]
MDFGFNDEQEALRRSAREVLADKAGPKAYRHALEKTKTGTDEALWKTIGDLGWAGVAIDEQHGGLGLGLIELVILQEEMGRALAPVPFFSTVALAGQLLEQAPAGARRDEALRAIASGGARATAALGQKDGSFDAAGVSVKAARTENGWTFSGTASLVPEAHLADLIVVVARIEKSRNPEEGLGLFLVPADALKSKPKPQPSLDGARRLADVRLGKVEAPADAFLADNAWPLIARALDRAAVLLAAEAVGVASRQLEIAVAHARDRSQFDRPIGSFQAISHKCADMLLVTETARSHVYYAAWALEEGAPDARLAAATAKAAASDAARIVANDSIQVHGGIGFTWEHEMHLFYRRAKFCELYLGDASAWRERVTAALAAAS